MNRHPRGACVLAFAAIAFAPGAALGQGAPPSRQRVIVALRQPAARSGAEAAAIQRDFLRAAQAARVDVAAVKTFSRLPYIVVDAATTDLPGLRRLAGVAGVQRDVAEPPALLESTALIGAPVVWRAGTDGSGVTIAILDTGVAADHPALAGRVVSEACYSTTSATSTSLCPGGVNSTIAGAAAPCAEQGCEHGTHVAGAAAGAGSPSGVAPGASIIAIQVFSRFHDEDCGTGYIGTCILSFVSDQMLALERVLELQGTFSIAAANLSLGGGLYASTQACDADNPGRRDIVARLRAANIAVVAAAGNDGQSGALSAPACLSVAISVGSVRDGSDGAVPRGAISTFSNSASFLSLLAPGEVITAPVPGGGYSTMRGTSMAAPHVAGAWALLRSTTPGADVDSTLGALRTTGDAIVDPRSGLQFPLIRVDRAVGALGAPACSFAASPTSAAATAAGGEVLVTVATGNTCAWTVSTAVAWVAAMPAGGVGAGTIRLRAAPNPGEARVGTAVVAGQVITIVQPAPVAPASTAGDLDRDGFADILWQHRGTGSLVVWMMNGVALRDSVYLQPATVADTDWEIVGSGDLNRDGTADLVWRHRAQGWLVAWLMRGRVLLDSVYLAPDRVTDPDWRIVAVADMDRDGHPDLVWRHRTGGWIVFWLMNGTRLRDSVYSSPWRVNDAAWEIAGAGDLNGDGANDLMWRHAGDGTLVAWLMYGITLVDSVELRPNRVTDRGWHIRAIFDIDRDGRADLVWQHATGTLAAWLMSGVTLRDSVYLFPARVADTDWVIAGPR